MVSLIVAYAAGRVIGRDNQLPWDMPADLRYFRDTTRGKTVIMGRKTYDSIVAKLGHGLPGRTNIVITRDVSYRSEGAQIVHSVNEALQTVGTEDCFIIGGSQIYQAALAFTDRAYVTEIDADILGDTYFPELDTAEWRELSRDHHDKDATNPYNYDFVILERIR